jgi:hypothetical protein
MIRSLSFRTRCATASSRASGEPAAGFACVALAVVPEDRGARLFAAVPLDRLPRDADDARDAVDPREAVDPRDADELRGDELRGGDDDPLPLERRDPPLRDDELEEDFEPLLLAWGNFSSLTWVCNQQAHYLLPPSVWDACRASEEVACSQLLGFGVASGAPCWRDY